jgi:hypothetical protein
MEKEKEKKFYVSSHNKMLDKETRRAISRIMLALETYTNYLELENVQKALVRDTILNQVNRLVRVTKNYNTIIFGKEE